MQKLLPILPPYLLEGSIDHCLVAKFFGSVSANQFLLNIVSNKPFVEGIFGIIALGQIGQQILDYSLTQLGNDWIGHGYQLFHTSKQAVSYTHLTLPTIYSV